MTREKKKKQQYKDLIVQSTVISEYGLSRADIDKYLPEPILRVNPHYRKAAPMRLFEREDVEKCIQKNPYLQKKHERLLEKKRKKERETENANLFLRQFSPEDILKEGRKIPRRFVLHVGPTNSGKTYAALQDLKQAGAGAYLGPLRLLALEVYETLNGEEIPCTLLTGEEYIFTPNSVITSSTIELCDFSKHYETVVIDEAQMLSDPMRGQHWFKAICLVDADLVDICLAPEALPIIKKIIKELNSEYVVINHERLVPLKFSGKFNGIEDIRSGDALITFSRKSVLQLADVLNENKIKASVIYGALPPASRREEVRRFSQKETDVVVATDAIGMGISLPIKRVVFIDTEKFDGDTVRKISVSEVKQIAGRAGRFGKYDLGEVLTVNNAGYIASSLKKNVWPIKKLVIDFPSEALDYDYPLDEMMELWDCIPEEPLFKRTSLKSARYLYSMLGNKKNADKKLIYSLISCPIDIKKDELVFYWRDSVHGIFEGRMPRKPTFESDDLMGCELQYKAYDVYHQLMRRIGVEDDCIEEKEALAQKINDILKQTNTPKFKRFRKRWRDEMPF